MSRNEVSRCPDGRSQARRADARRGLGGPGVRALVLERKPTPPGFCRGFNPNARSMELLDRRGLAAGFLAEGPTLPTKMFVGPSRLDLTTMRTKHRYALGIPQTHVKEPTEWALRSGARLVLSRCLTRLRQEDDGVTAEVDGRDGAPTVCCRWLAGCDGGRSTVRKAAGISFPPGHRHARLSMLSRTASVCDDVDRIAARLAHPGQSSGQLSRHRRCTCC
ncbi:FAD-dependent monooxygenase [Streptomyces sp. YS-3]|uniref:FAD-dependent monooxygenase n=1 Tax=Streptomyces sp. YS-3 TaxID=3381352 RepID=UPI003862BF4A